MHTGEEVHARPGWITSRLGQDSQWNSLSKWQTTEINGESTSIEWSTRGSKTVKEQNRTEHDVRTRNFYHMTLCASAVYITALCLSLCVTSRSSTKWLNVWLRTFKFRPLCDVHFFSFIDDFTCFTCKRNQPYGSPSHKNKHITVFFFILFAKM